MKHSEAFIHSDRWDMVSLRSRVLIVLNVFISLYQLVLVLGEMEEFIVSWLSVFIVSFTIKNLLTVISVLSFVYLMVYYLLYQDLVCPLVCFLSERWIAFHFFNYPDQFLFP